MQQLHGAKIHIFDNDTSGEIRSIWMTVRYRCGQSNDLPPVWIFCYLLMRDRSMGSCLSWADKVLPIMRKMEVLKIDNTEAKVKGKMVPIWEKYMLTVDEAVLYFGIGEKKIRMLISENVDSDYCFTVQVGNKSLINRHKFEEFLNQTTSL